MTGWHEPAPGEREAVERSWEIVREAFEERIPAPRRRDWRPFALAAVAAAVVAAALSPPGHAVFGSLRDAVRGLRCRASQIHAKCGREAFDGLRHPLCQLQHLIGH